MKDEDYRWPHVLPMKAFGHPGQAAKDQTDAYLKELRQMADIAWRERQRAERALRKAVWKRDQAVLYHEALAAGLRALQATQAEVEPPF